MKAYRLLLVAAITVLFAMTSPVHAATIFDVNHKADLPDTNPGDGKCQTSKKTCTLRAAIQESNAICGGDYGCEETINLPAGTYKLTRVGNDDTALAGDLDITGSVTIRGDGAASTIIDGNGGVTNNRVLHLVSNYPPAQFVNLKGVTLTNGKSDQGGGIYNQGGHLTLDNSQVLYSTSTAQGGGGISSDGGSVDLIESTIALNAAKGTFGFGGGVHLKKGNLFVSKSTFLNNTADGTHSYGGAIYVGEGLTVISDSVLEANTSQQYGGAIRISGGELGIHSSIIKDNYAGVAGGGVYVASYSKFSLKDSTVSGNMADINVGDGGGGVYLDADATITGTEFINNSATKGGGIYKSGGTATVTGSTLDDNYGAVSGGAIYHFWGPLDITGSTLSRNHSNTLGGGIHLYGGKLHLTNSTVSSNAAKQQGGGIFVDGSQVNLAANLSLYNATVATNTAGQEGKGGGKGGGIQNNQGGVFIQNTILADNIAYDTANPTPNECGGTVSSNGYNLIETLNGCTVSGISINDITGQDPQLGPLQGGPTETHKIPLGSPAVDKGNPNGCMDANGVLLEQDQRGHDRHLEGDGDGAKQCDIGAYENGESISPQP